ncbi:hypothetical protein chiPu_0018678 [Chiloscyllium punctatum]|uniref:Uncharacterized protein n=1 Tax=Chiloscyllium punctatum TaxID=137246 RepID=A0A401RPF0_CHIPU|nr:hypothetical protein [Chiloscyllium punctatum]
MAPGESRVPEQWPQGNPESQINGPRGIPNPGATRPGESRVPEQWPQENPESRSNGPRRMQNPGVAQVEPNLSCCCVWSSLEPRRAGGENGCCNKIIRIVQAKD